MLTENVTIHLNHASASSFNSCNTRYVCICKKNRHNNRKSLLVFLIIRKNVPAIQLNEITYSKLYHKSKMDCFVEAVNAF